MASAKEKLKTGRTAKRLSVVAIGGPLVGLEMLRRGSGRRGVGRGVSWSVGRKWEG